MTYKYYYKTPDGFSDMLMNSDGEYLTGLWFDGSRDASKHTLSCEEKTLPIFEDTIKWLDIYFSGKNPDFTPKYKIANLTEFRQEVIDIMLEIPFGEVKTYGEIAEIIAKKHGIAKMSSRAVGGAVGWNPICIIIPCHRVVGSNNSLTGYGGGIANKVSLLKHENNDMSRYKIPKKGTAL
jgi:methylated-DNA-[protein]-cysteine S-methyltransferase